MHGLRQRLQSSARGSALVELAMALPLLVLILVGTIDFARAFHMAIVLQNAARAGAQYGSISTGNASDTTGMNSAVTTSAAVDIGTVSASSSENCFCATDSNPAASSVACTATCSSGSHLVVSVTVTAASTFSTVTRFPGIPHTFSISRSATLRAQ
jgi:Flp pilus assembly protein TadG